MKNLCYAIIGLARFLECSSEDLIDPDEAVAAMEEMAATLQAATLPERRAFVAACQSEADRLRAVGALHAGTFVADLPATMGLSIGPGH